MTFRETTAFAAICLCLAALACQPPIPGGGGGPQPPYHATFLLDDAATRVMNCLSYQLDDGGFRQVVSRSKAAGANAMYVYLSNRGDGRPAVTSFYRNDLLGPDIDQGRLTLMKNRLIHIRGQGLAVVAWLFADDSSSVSRRPLAEKLAYAAACVQHFGALVDEWVVALEANEHLPLGDCRQVAAALHQGGSQKVGIHLTSGQSDWARQPEFDVLYYQYGFGKSAAAIEAETRQVVARLGKPVVAAEYHKSSDSAAARALGQAALRGGASGTGNGH